MNRSTRLIALAVVAALLIAFSLYLHLWGGVVLVGVAAAGILWYRMQVARSQAGEAFFGEAGEDTRLTAFQAGSPSEMPVDRGRHDDQPH
jgi:hypothetical protein